VRLCCGSLGALLILAVPVKAVLPMVDMRHSVVRVPERDFLELWLKPSTDDQIDAALWDWVKTRKATLLSDIESSVETRKPTSLTQGRRIFLPTENDQGYEDLVLTPTDFGEQLIGTTLKFDCDSRLLYDAGLIFRSDWQVDFRPAAPAISQWPVTWPENPAKRIGWYDRQDVFIERVVTSTAWCLGGRSVLAIMRPADAVFPAGDSLSGAGHLDVMLTRVRPGEGLADHTVEGQERPPTGSGTVSVISISLESREALALLLNRDPATDADLLEALLKRVADGSATLCGFTSTAVVLDQRVELESARRHSYPTEMPTIPSAWQERSVGTELTVEVGKESVMNLALEQHLVPPRDGTWQVALDAPEMILRQPQFVSFTTRSQLPLPDSSTVLQSALHIPACLSGTDGVLAGRTILTFTKQRSLKDLAPRPKAEGGGLFMLFGDALDPLIIEVTALILEVPATEEDHWKGQTTDLFQANHHEEVLRRIADGSATIKGLAVGAFGLAECSFGIAEDVVEVSECEPDYRQTPGRLRPTGLNQIRVGTVFSGSISRTDDDKKILSYKLVHHPERPALPTLQEMITFSKAHRDRGLPPAQISMEDWEGEFTLIPDQMTLLKVQRPPGKDGQARLHLLFMRSRQILGKGKP
jgi:hypothetical protein